jgi:hypothetical protein
LPQRQPMKSQNYEHDLKHSRIFLGLYRDLHRRISEYWNKKSSSRKSPLTVASSNESTGRQPDLLASRAAS